MSLNDGLSRITFESHLNEMAVRESQPTEPILASAADFRREVREHKKRHHHGQIAARVPAVFHFKWVSEFKRQNGGKMNSREFAKFVKRKLNDPEMKYFRIWEGRV